MNVIIFQFVTIFTALCKSVQYTLPVSPCDHIIVIH